MDASHLQEKKANQTETKTDVVGAAKITPGWIQRWLHAISSIS